MERKTYYTILGIPSTESASGIRAAYRDLAKKLHPDATGEATARAFREATEAYDVLSDAARRRDYDNALRYAAPSLGARRNYAEPAAHEHVSIFANPESIRPSFAAMYERLLRNFTGIRVPKGEVPEALEFEVLLTPEESARGCVVPIGVPVFRPCVNCSGSGYDWALDCRACEGSGIVEGEARLEVHVQPMLPSGSVLEVPLRRLGIDNFHLRVHLYVHEELG